ncbi:MAG: HEAT repeat domain-containing protein [Verrucomicrobiae bacterium]|nr:HEAT repeat domain-containing protein [Verrucomicrobiae bacterium]
MRDRLMTWSYRIRHQANRLSGFVRFYLTVVVLSSPFAVAQQPNSHQRKLDRIQRWVASKDPTVREQAVREAALFLPADQARPILLQALKDPAPQVRAVAAWQLKDHRVPGVAEALLSLLQDENDRVRAAAVWALSGNAGRRYLKQIMQLSREDPSGVVRFRAVWGLGLIGDRTALPVVIEALGDYNNAVRDRAAVIALETLADAKIVSHLLTQTNNVLPASRRIVMYLLGKYGDRDRPTAIAALMKGLQDPDARVRGQAALALGRLKANQARAALEAASHDSDDHVRGAATHALGLIGDTAALPAVRARLRDEAAFVRAIAAEALNRLGDHTVQPPEEFRAEELFTYPIHTPEHQDLF